ncbi:MAG: class I SAM-dependent methyltransferase [Patescibacteria group bacterium]
MVGDLTEETDNGADQINSTENSIVHQSLTATDEDKVPTPLNIEPGADPRESLATVSTGDALKDTIDVPQYTEEFNQLISTDIKELLDGSEVVNMSYPEWEHGRAFIADVISKPGTIIDFGCANGFLLKCLQEWTGLHDKLIPYGVDTNADHIQDAKRLYPSMPDHFLTLSPDNTEAINEYPTSFDTVYWCVWDDLKYDDFKKVYDQLYQRTKPGGRLIMGSYLPDKQNNLDRIADYSSRLQNDYDLQSDIVSAPIDNPKDNQALFYIDKKQ